MTQPPIDDDFQDRIQRIINDKKKDELRDKYGMQFEWHSDEFPPEAEGEWLDYITEFEQQFENAKQIAVRELIGNPTIKPLSEIPESELEAELDNLLELLARNNIAIEFIHEQDDRETYRFITEELLDEMTDDIHLPGMTSHFIYEEFHPNDEDDATQAVEEFCFALFEQEFKDWNSMYYHTLSHENLLDAQGNAIDLEQFKKLVAGFYEENPVILDHSVKVAKVTINGDRAAAEALTIWRVIPKNESAVIRKEGLSKFKLERCVYGGWDIFQANVAGWHS